MRDIRSGRLVDNKFRSEDDVERATLDEHEMQFLYKDGDVFHFMNTESYEQTHLSQEVLGDSALYLLPDASDQGGVLRDGAGGHRAAADGGFESHGHGAGHQGRDGVRPNQAGDDAKRAWSSTCRHSSIRGDVIRINTETGEYLGRT